jgi:hypothetical protein
MGLDFENLYGRNTIGNTALDTPAWGRTADDLSCIPNTDVPITIANCYEKRDYPI